MCTVSWLRQNKALHVFCNRDEQRTRAVAIPPRIFQTEQGCILYPEDPVGKGTWVAVSDTGFCVTVLNHYPENYALPETVVSRGQLVKQLAMCADMAHAGQTLKALDMSAFRPCLLLLLDEKESLRFTWDGKQLLEEACPSFTGSISTSSYKTKVVQAYRDQLFADVAAAYEEVQPADLQAYHLHAEPGLEKESILMSRPESCTVSYARITIRPDKIQFDYYDQEPLGAGLPQTVLLSRET